MAARMRSRADAARDDWAALDAFLAGENPAETANDANAPTLPSAAAGEPGFSPGPASQPAAPSGPAAPAGLRSTPQASGGQGSVTVKGGILRFKAADHVASALASAPTPGGIAALVFALVFFLMAIVPVNGNDTRLSLLWGVLTGTEVLPPGNATRETLAQQNAINTIGGVVTGNILQPPPTSGGGIGSGPVSVASPSGPWRPPRMMPAYQRTASAPRGEWAI